ncbi:YdcF family protein [Mucilaginibacter aquatilis]|uniref:YdcF family protein n=1 Tax=Mucilaginibacter aquatilis TaxID=1517760 RepID=A0A6I4I718_9SPHI|nr:YdcF family protein [Mucilaginibacter aquatilis]MVN90891.1 YdcF family protein [Mucilaginibacter aquatilis]
MKRCLMLFVWLLIGNASFSQFMGAQPGYKPLSGGDWVKSKNCYMLTLLEEDKAVASLLQTDVELAKLAAAKHRAIQLSLSECKDALCLPGFIKFTSQEISVVSNRLKVLYKVGNALDVLVKKHIIPSGMYIRYNDLAPVGLLVKAWEQDAACINYIISVYAEAKKPNYPQIDSISYDIKKRSYYTLMYDCTSEVVEAVNKNDLFFKPSLYAALTYLEVNERRQAADYEPMVSTANKLAAERIKQTKWTAYSYSHILVPGAGPDNLTTPLSGEGMLRCKTAARQYFANKAPFVVVSGGAVHPFKTKYNEAVEMRKYMINVLHVPAYAVIIEPHARHTTTNLRNDARLIFRYGMPFGKPGLIITDKYQNDFIANMEQRCLKELGYVPYKLGKRLSDTALEFYPLVTALQTDADEPMDP